MLIYQREAESRLETFLKKLDEQNDYFDGEEGIRLNHARIILQRKFNKEQNFREQGVLEEALIILDDKYEKLPGIYK
jgi:hypothetical protein